ncbi:MAG TPA: ParB N-terminal domain-containing protein [Pirellulaceae bacterium]|nr:ParB N-terminal domain-containing protein [Pirellulaceae bacterium]
MKITIIPLEKIVPYEKNPRNTEAAIDAVAESIREFGFRQPIVVDPEYVIVAGHARYFAAVRLGLDKVPVHFAKDLTPEQIRAYRLADNKTHDLAGWDDELLAQEIMALSESEIDLAKFGFDQAFLDSLGDQVDEATFEQSTSSTQMLQLKFGKYSVPLDEAEFGRLVTLLDEHVSRTGTKFGFVNWLIEESDVPSEVPAE